MGDQGPCGPCSEIHVDLRPDAERAEVSGRSLVNADHPQVVEIWNNVFMEFNRKADGSLEKLPAKHVDTGMGFERLCMAMQNVTSNYDTDVFTPLIAKVEEITGLKYTTNDVILNDSEESQEQNKTNIAIRVIVDHVRAVAFAIADGQLPSNNGAGYVIHRGRHGAAGGYGGADGRIGTAGRHLGQRRNGRCGAGRNHHGRSGFHHG